MHKQNRCVSIVKLLHTSDKTKLAITLRHILLNTGINLYRIVSNKRPGGVAIFQKGDVYKSQVFNAKMQCLSLFTMTLRREI